MDLKEIVGSTPSPNKKNKSIPSVRFTLSSFKKHKDDEENLNQINVREKVMDYSEKVRDMNRTKTSPDTKPSEFQDHPYETVNDLIGIFHLNGLEEYYLSDSSDNFVTSYQRY